jgi:hypothetical protein
MPRSTLVGAPLAGALALLGSVGCPGPSDSSPPELTSTTITATDGNASDTGDDDGSNPIDPSAVDGDDDSSSSGGGGANCGEVDFVLAPEPPGVMLVLDRSGSMTNLWDGDADPTTPNVTRWASLHGVVESVVTEFEAEIDFGAGFFPSASAIDQLGIGACLVKSTPEVLVAPANAAAILADPPMPPADVADLSGATPATAGIESALGHLQTLDPDVARFIVLVTDGAANCSADADLGACPGLGCELMELYDERLPLVVGAAHDELGIPTFVVGIDIRDQLVGVGPDGIEGTPDDADGQPAANTFQRLTDVAVAGGRPRAGTEKFFNAANGVELQAALEEIAGQVFSCVVTLDPPPPHPQ